MVTGGAGFIGSYLFGWLLDMGEVVCLNNFDPYYSPQAKRNNIEPLTQHLDFNLLGVLDKELLYGVCGCGLCVPQCDAGLGAAGF